MISDGSFDSLVDMSAILAGHTPSRVWPATVLSEVINYLLFSVFSYHCLPHPQISWCHWGIFTKSRLNFVHVVCRPFPYRYRYCTGRARLPCMCTCGVRDTAYGPARARCGVAQSHNQSLANKSMHPRASVRNRPYQWIALRSVRSPRRPQLPPLLYYYSELSYCLPVDRGRKADGHVLKMRSKNEWMVSACCTVLHSKLRLFIYAIDLW